MLRPDQSTPATPPPDLHVGPYRVLSRLGEGGMGVVHLGQAPDGRRVAIKVLRPHVVGDEEARQRLAREVDSLGRVRSPRVAEIVDADPWGPVPYVATRYVPGLSLSDHVRDEAPIAGADLPRFARALGEALQAVHAVGVLHRDIKPSNVVMEGRNPVLIDFGLARVADDARLTRTGWLLGTPGYIAPEVLMGEDAGEPADVHGWAATVAFAGLGRGPFGTGPSMAILDRVRRGQHDLGDLGGELRDLLERALDPEPRRRPSLDDALSGLPGGAPSRASGSDGPTVPLAAAYAAGLVSEDDVTAREAQGADPTPTASPAPRSWTWTEEDEPAAERPGQPVMPAAREPYQSPPPADWTPVAPARTPLAERLRRWLLAGTGLVALAAAAGAAPYLTAAAAGLVVVVLRWYSFTTSQVQLRRSLRGAKWYDVVLTPLSTPWHLARSVPGSVLLLLWSATLVAAVGLVLVALRVEAPLVLWLCGIWLGTVVWIGPGAAEVRRPLRRVAHALARDTGPLLGALAALVVVAALAVWVTGDRGTDWSPDQGPPWRGIDVLVED